MKFIFITGIIFFIGSLFLLPYSLKKLEVGQYGTIVKMKIERMPSSCIGANIHYYVSFSYNNKRYEKQTRGGFCEQHYIGELVDVKMIPGEDTILWPFDSGIGDILSLIGLGLFGLSVSIGVVVKSLPLKNATR